MDEMPANTAAESDDAPEAADVEMVSEHEDGEPFDKDRALAKIRKVNAEAAALRKRLKELEPLAEKAQELEDANKSDTEKLTERLSAAEKRAAEAEAKLLRLEVAQEKGLTLAQAQRLVGTTKEELLADADELLSAFGATQPKTPPAKAPREALKGGGLPADEPEDSIEAILNRIPRG